MIESHMTSETRVTSLPKDKAAAARIAARARMFWNRSSRLGYVFVTSGSKMDANYENLTHMREIDSALKRIAVQTETLRHERTVERTRRTWMLRTRAPYTLSTSRSRRSDFTGLLYS